MRLPLWTALTMAALVCAISVFGMFPARANDWQKGIAVSMDYATTMKLPAGVATLIIGNPIIADATVQQGGIMVVTGKSYGTTNLIALDRSGAKIAETIVRVQSVNNSVVRVFRGIERETYTCAPHCERSVTVGDTDTYFTSTIAQGNNRIQQGGTGTPPASAPAAAPPPPRQ